MLWLQRPPWAKWIATGIVVIAAVWVEIAPDATVMHPFATSAISPGDPIDAANTVNRRVPAGLLAAIAPGAHATRRIEAGDPVLASETGDPTSIVPPDWWVVASDLPSAARSGDHVQLILLDTGRAVPGIVAAEASDDPFGEPRGAIAVAPAVAAEVAVAAASGRVVVLVGTG